MPRGSGSSHSSSSHGGFSSHSHSSGFSSSGGRGFSSGPRGSSSFHSGPRPGGGFGPGPGPRPPHIHHHYYGGPRYRGPGYRGRNNAGCGTIFIVLFVILFVLAFIGSYLPDTPSSNITQSTIMRTKLPDGLCEKSSRIYTDEWGDWIAASPLNDVRDLNRAADKFMDLTGVQPYIWITGANGASIKNSEDLEAFAREKYDMLFDDRGHLLIVFREYPNTSGEYISGCYAGADAETVLDAEAREIVLDYIDHYYNDTELSEAKLFAKALESSAAAIMHDSSSDSNRSEARNMISIVFGAVLLIFLVVWVRRKKKQINTTDGEVS